jgi:hypothetical protein
MTTTSQLPGVNIMLLGPTGTGKTFSIKTLIDRGITPMCLFTEPGFEVLGDVPKDKLHWMYIPPIKESLDDIIAKADKVATMTFEALTKSYDGARNKDNRFTAMVKALNNFTCDRTGEEFGSVSKWGTDKALVIDSLSGIGIAVMNSIVGTRPAKNMSDWGLAQDQLEGVINWCCTSTRCHFILLAHAERETDEVQGGTQIMASTLGKKLAPKLPRFFSDVILAQRQGTKFTWSTAATGADLKARNVPIANDIKPDFGQIIDSWRSRGGVIEP